MCVWVVWKCWEMVALTCKVKLGVLSFLNKNVSCGCNDFWRSSLKWGYQAQTVGLWNVRSGFYLMHIFHRHSGSCFKAIKRWRSTSGTCLLMEYVLCFVSRNREQWIGSEEVCSRSVKCILWIGVCFAERMALQGLSFHFCLFIFVSAVMCYERQASRTAVLSLLRTVHCDLEIVNYKLLTVTSASETWIHSQWIGGCAECSESVTCVLLIELLSFMHIFSISVLTFSEKRVWSTFRWWQSPN